MFRRFADAIIRPQSVLFIIGYSFGDEHLNAIIDQALAYPSFTMVVISPGANRTRYLQRVNGDSDPGIWCLAGPQYGKFDGFVRLLPDLLNEDRTREVIRHRAELARWLKTIHDHDNDTPPQD